MKHSRLHQWNWKPVSRTDVLTLLAVLINIGLDRRSAISEYWRKMPHKSTPWYGQVMPGNKFQLMFQTMLHASHPDALGQAKICDSVASVLIFTLLKILA